MQRESRTPRADWQQRVESLGFDFHTIDGEAYWREDVCYRFTSDEVDVLEDATSELHSMCLEAVDRVVRDGRYADLGLDDTAAKLVEQSWRAGEPALYGRMDLSWDGSGEPKLLEYNADTPTALFEASVVQWYWLQDVLRDADQFNSIHEKLIERWKQVHESGKIHFSAVYEQPGRPRHLRIPARHGRAGGIRHRNRRHRGNRLERPLLSSTWTTRPIATLFKLYPWEWLLADEFGANIPKVRDALDRTGVEDGAVEQVDPAAAVGIVSRSSEPAAGIASARRSVRRDRAQAALRTRRRGRDRARRGHRTSRRRQSPSSISSSRSCRVSATVMR